MSVITKDGPQLRMKGPEAYFPEERAGWKGYIEWEDYPEKKKKAAKILAQYDFPPPPEYQLALIPQTNPLLEGVRWKQYHYALGPYPHRPQYASARDSPGERRALVQRNG
ncbi:hypothetical protein BJ546DRAFT_1060373 [Cryomyces antarcticus]